MNLRQRSALAEARRHAAALPRQRSRLWHWKHQQACVAALKMLLTGGKPMRAAQPMDLKPINGTLPSSRRADSRG